MISLQFFCPRVFALFGPPHGTNEVLAGAALPMQNDNAAYETRQQYLCALKFVTLQATFRLQVQAALLELGQFQEI